MMDPSMVIKDPKVLLHVLLTICGLAPTTALWLYAPTIIGSFGYGRLQANALVSVGQWISVCLIIIAAFVADRTGRRGFVVLFGVFCQWTFMVAFRALPDSSSAGLKFGIVTMGTATCSWWHSVNGSWLSINASCPEKRAIRMAIFIMAANCAGIVGGQLFRSDDLPYHHRGWTIIAVLISIALSAFISLLIIYWQANRHLASGGNVTDQSAGDYGNHENGLQRRNRSAASPYNY
ncbi:nicotinamide mononucleotide permease [Fusarium fujikuroi]|nr:nicotinamide mononucleotide permease [Fusarium fujikuroi]